MHAPVARSRYRACTPARLRLPSLPCSDRVTTKGDVMFNRLWCQVLAAADRFRREERGDSLVNWVVLAVGLAAAAAAVVALLRPAIQDAGQTMVDFISGSG